MSPWLPNGKLKDGTLLLGPLNNKPAADRGPYVEGQFNGRSWFVVYSGNALKPEQIAEVKEWAEKVLASRTQ